MKPAKSSNRSASGLIKTGQGSLKGVFVSVASGSPTIQFVDGITDNDDVADKATGVLTMSGAIVPGVHALTTLTSTGAMVPADYGTNTLTSDATNVADAEVVVIGAITYRFKDTMAQAYDVKIGADAATSLANLKKAINGTGTPGTEYFAGTVAHTLVIADTLTATTLKVWSRTLGTTNNTLATTETSTHLAWADTTLGGGTGASDPGVTAAGADIVIGSITYEIVVRLAQTIGLTAVPYQVIYGGTEATMLDKLKLAINATGSAGTDYGTGTVAHTLVFATTNTDTTQVIVSRTVGVGNNSLGTTETLANTAWTASTLGGGTIGVATTNATFTINSRVYTFVTALTENCGGIATADQVLWVTNNATALDNMKIAINDSGGTQGTEYSTGTSANVDVTATTNTNTAQTIEAITAGIAGNIITTTETLANTSWGAATLTGGLEVNLMLVEQFTPVAGTNYVFNDMAFTAGLYIRIGSTVECQVAYD